MNSIIMPLSMLNMITAYFYLPPFCQQYARFFVPSLSFISADVLHI